MATWTTPRTWVTGEVVTAAQLNEQIRDNTTFAKEMGENASVGVIFNGGGADISTDDDYTVFLPGAGTLLGAVLRAGEDDILDSANTILINVQRIRDSDGDTAFDSDDEIVAGVLLLDSDSGLHARYTADSDWTTALYENDQIRWTVEDCAGVTKCTAQLLVHKG